MKQFKMKGTIDFGVLFDDGTSVVHEHEGLTMIDGPYYEYETTVSQEVKLFEMTRPQAPSDYVSKGLTNNGEKPDFQGAVFPDGTTVVRWLTSKRSTSLWRSFEDLMDVHGHSEYGSVIKWL